MIIIITTFVFGVLFGTAVVSGGSMQPTLHDGEKALVRLLWANNPRRGDIVVIKQEDKNIIKRVIATSGDTIQIKDGQVIVNDVILDETYIESTTETNGFIEPTVIKPNHVFVLGDNRGISVDSRVLGQISCDNIYGIVIKIINGE